MPYESYRKAIQDMKPKQSRDLSSEEEIAPWDEVPADEVAPWDENIEKESVEKTSFGAPIEQTTPDIKGRAVVKNFGGTPEEQISYLQTLNPDVDFRIEDGDIITKSKLGDTWHPLDPSSFQLSEIVPDITDVGYDIGSGLLQGAATAATALTPGGMLAAAPVSAATGAGLEAVRQRIGKSLGAGEMDPAGIKVAGALGLVAPLVFGAGATKKAIDAKALKAVMDTVKSYGVNLSEHGIDTAIEKETLRLGHQSKGIPGRLAPHVGSALTGIGADVMEKAGQIMPFIKEARENPNVRSKLYNQFATDVHEKIAARKAAANATIKEIKNQADTRAIGVNAEFIPTTVTGYGGPLDNVISGKMLDTKPTKEALELTVAQMENTASAPADKIAMARIKHDLFKEVLGMDEKITAEQAHARYRQLYSKSEQLYKKIDAGTAKPGDEFLAGMYKKAAIDLEQGMKNKVYELIPDRANDFIHALDTHSDMKILENSLQFGKPRTQEGGKKIFMPKEEKAVSKFLRDVRSDPSAKKTAQLLQEQLGVDVESSALKEAALKEYVDANENMARSAAGGAGGTIAGWAGGKAAELATGAPPGLLPRISAIAGGFLGGRGFAAPAIKKTQGLYIRGRELVPDYLRQRSPYLILNNEANDLTDYFRPKEQE